MKKLFLILTGVLVISGTVNSQTTVTTASDVSIGGINYETGTAILSSVNAILTSLNLTGINTQIPEKYTQAAAVVTGLGQVGYGLYNQSQGNSSALDWVNYSVGAATAITNAIKLFQPAKKTGGKTVSWNIYYLPPSGNNHGAAVGVVKYFKI